jgi:hypothetical protein
VDSPSTLLANMLAALCVFSCVGAMSAPENPPSTLMPYCMPGAACWPKPNVWSAFNQSIDGMLHGPPPPILSLRALRSPHLSLYESLSPSVSPSHRSEYIADHRTVHGTTCGA